MITLPLFHAFGFTCGGIMPLVTGSKLFLYPSPLHYRVIPTAFYNLDCTILFGTNTFLNGYARKAHAYDFREVRYLFADCRWALDDPGIACAIALERAGRRHALGIIFHDAK